MKYLVIAAVIVLLLLFIYSRLRPYLKLVGKIVGTVKGMAQSPLAGNMRTARDTRLVRCVSCGTWVPVNRALGPKPAVSPYCSRECLEKSVTVDQRKAAS